MNRMYLIWKPFETLKFFTITFDQFIVLFLNKIINLFKINETVLYTYSANIFLKCQVQV